MSIKCGCLECHVVCPGSTGLDVIGHQSLNKAQRQVKSLFVPLTDTGLINSTAFFQGFICINLEQIVLMCCRHHGHHRPHLLKFESWYAPFVVMDPHDPEG